MSGQRVRLLGGHDQTEPSNDGPGTGAGSNNYQFKITIKAGGSTARAQNVDWSGWVSG